MNLAALRQEVLNHGFDPSVFTTRINTYLNDGMNLIARRVDYYVDEAVSQFQTVTGTDTYPWPADLARVRSLFDTDRSFELQYSGLRAMDRSAKVNGAPSFYAISGANTRLYPVPDGIYNLELRYWKMPTPMIADTDSPSLPADWHSMLWVYAVGICYEAEDDPQMGQYWSGRFANELSMFAADQKFPNADGPNVARGMWDSEPFLDAGSNQWTFFGG